MKPLFISIALMAAGTIFGQTCKSPMFPGPATPIDSSKCTVVGNDGSETNQNKAKNNFCPSNASPQSMMITDFVALQTSVQKDKTIPFGNPDTHPLTSKAGPATNRAPLVKLGEGKEVVLTAFVKIARQEGKESVNCTTKVPDQPMYHDIHISLVGSASDAECDGLVAEMIPRHRPAAWTADLVNMVASAKLSVRVTGQLMFDSSHTPCQNGAEVKGDPSRATLWEIHPIYKFEVCPSGTCDSGGWVALEAWKP